MWRYKSAKKTWMAEGEL